MYKGKAIYQPSGKAADIIEIWKDVPEYEGLYQVSNLGRIKSLPRNGTRNSSRILKPRVDLGYERVWLSKADVVKPHKISRIVASVFILNPFNKPEVNHIDGNKSNNNVNNLEWVTKSENIKHAFNTGLAKPIREQKHAVINYNIAHQIRVLCETGMKQVDIARKFNITPQLVSSVKLNKSWSQCESLPDNCVTRDYNMFQS
jgi:hypothetical protein